MVVFILARFQHGHVLTAEWRRNSSCFKIFAKNVEVKLDNECLRCKRWEQILLGKKVKRKYIYINISYLHLCVLISYYLITIIIISIIFIDVKSSINLSQLKWILSITDFNSNPLRNKQVHLLILSSYTHDEIEISQKLEFCSPQISYTKFAYYIILGINKLSMNAEIFYHVYNISFDRFISK